MSKRTRSCLATSDQNRTQSTPRKRTRIQTQTVAEAEKTHATLHGDSGIYLESPSQSRKNTRARNLRINTHTIMPSSEMISSPTEGHPSEFLGIPTAVDGMNGYKPPKRQGPANPRRHSNPVLGIAPKANLGDRLRLAADRVFQYSPISAKQVRLMRLERGEPNDPIKVEVMAVPFQVLGKDYTYEALSYHWGEDDAAKPLSIRDISPPPKAESPYQNWRRAQPREIRVKYNLYEALYHLRSAEQDLWLWVDALCIDQDNPKEKEVQLERIADIYVAAENVLVWLGEGTSSTTQAIKLLKELACMEQQSDIFADKSRLLEWKNLTYLMRASWFSRRWVIQELALAKNAIVSCGNDEIHWNDLRDGISLFVQSEDLIRKEFQESPGFNHDYHALEDLEPLPAKILIDKVDSVFDKTARAGKFVATKSLETLVSSLFAFHASDPRDTINGLINISKEGIGLDARVRAQTGPGPQSKRQSTTILNDTMRENPSRIAQIKHAGKDHPPPPSYRKDLLDVYVDFLKWIVKSTGSINILCRHWAIPERSRWVSGYPERVTLPTWIMLTSDGPFKHNETTWCRQNGDSLVGLPGESPYNACERYSEAKIEFSIHQATETATSGPISSDFRKTATAEVQGLRLGTIHCCTDPMSGGNITMQALEMLGWKKGEAAKHYDELKDDIWKPLVADRGFHGESPPPLWRKSCMDILANYTVHGSVNIDMIMPKIKLPHTKDFLKRMRKVTWNRKFLEVKLDKVFVDAYYYRGRSVGLGPTAVQEGDIVCILYGCSVPCVLRPRRNHNGTENTVYEFLGESYVYGFMAGEAITMLEKSELEKQQTSFTLI